MVVLLDACLLINLLRVGRADLLECFSEYDFRVTSLVAEEITDEKQKVELASILERGVVRLEPITDQEVIVEIEKQAKEVGRGEASCLVLGWKTGWAVGTDDGKARRLNEKAERPTPLLTTPGLIVQAIRKGLLTVAEADEIKERLEAHRFTMAFKSFQDVL
jgi:predicted nucleic acid-binding protein